MKQGVAKLEDIIEELVKRTGYNKKTVEDSVKYINKRMVDILEDEDVLFLRFPKLFTLERDIMAERMSMYRTQVPDIKEYKKQRIKIIEDFYKKKGDSFYRNRYKKHIFSKRRETDMTDEELQEFQNSQ